MSVTFADILERVLRLLNDPNGLQYEDALVWDGVIAGHDAILPFLPKHSVTTYTSGSAGDLFALPDDLYQVQTVQDMDSGLFIPRATLSPGTFRLSDGALSDNDWIEYPSGYLSLAKSVPEGSQLRLFYFSYWDKPPTESSQDFVLELPPVAHQGLIYYAGSHALLTKSVNSANIRQFNQRIDSGDPEDNPLKAESEHLRKLFYAEMKLLPDFVKVGA